MPSHSPRWALITGASSGLGSQFAEQLAARGFHVALVARRSERLNELAERLRSTRDVSVRCYSVDLSEPGASASLVAQLARDQIEIHVLINNAGRAFNGRFADMTVEHTRQQLTLNMLTITELTALLLPAMRHGRGGYILNVASIQAFMSVPGYATYAATKAYILGLSEALHVENAAVGVSVGCLCPGPTATEFFDVAGHQFPSIFRFLLMQPEDVVRIGLKGLFAGKRVVISGLRNRLLVAGLRMVPRFLHLWLTQRLVAGVDTTQSARGTSTKVLPEAR